MIDRLTKWIGPALLALVALSGLYLVFLLYVSGQTIVAGACLVIVALALIVFLHPRLYSYRYLFPGAAGALIFVVFPMIYTIAIGFTNYSSKNLLEFDRARQYLLDDTYQAEGGSFTMSLHPDGAEYRIQLTNEDETQHFVTEPQGLKSQNKIVLKAQPLADAHVELRDPLELRDIIRMSDNLKSVKIELPNGVLLSSSGLREFAPVHKLWVEGKDGSLTNQQTGAVIRPNFTDGFYETAAKEQIQPGFKVFVGGAHFKRILSDESIRQPFFRIFLWNVVFSLASVVCTASLGMFLAVLLNWEALRFRSVYRMFLFLPYAVPGFISILVFRGLFNANFGEINLILNSILGIRPQWFTDPTLAKLMLIIVNTWLGYPYMMVISQGLIKSIPADLYEASALAGAGPIANFTKITAPLILKPLMPLLISSFAFNFNNFVLISLLTNGRPDFLDTKIPAGTTDLLVSYTYRLAFADSGQQFGLAAAISTVIFVLVAILSIVNLRLTKVNAVEAR